MRPSDRNIGYTTNVSIAGVFGFIYSSAHPQFCPFRVEFHFLKGKFTFQILEIRLDL